MAEVIDFFGRLDMFMKYRGLNDNKISVTAGISNGLIGKGRKRGGISQENISKLITAYPELNANWLLTGQGDMLRGQSAPEVAPPPSEPAFPGFIEEIKSLSVKVGRLEAENEHLRAAIEAKQREIEEGTREIDNKEREIEAQQKEIEAKQREIERLQIENRLSHSDTTKKRAHEMANPTHESAVPPHSIPPTSPGLLNSQSQNTPSHL